VPLIRTAKFIYENNEQLEATVEIAHYGSAPLNHVTPAWQIKDRAGKILYSGKLKTTDVPIGNGFKLGQISQSLSGIDKPGKLVLEVNVGGYINTWDIFVYPSHHPESDKSIYVTQQLDEKAIAMLNGGAKVLLTLKKDAIKPGMGGDVVVGFSSIFWNTSWTNNLALLHLSLK